jgi:hypothetical protein
MWWIQYYRKGMMYRESTRTPDKSEATRILILRLAAVSEETILEAEFERVRVAEIAADFFREAGSTESLQVMLRPVGVCIWSLSSGRFEPNKWSTFGWMNTSTTASNRERRTLRSIVSLES